MRVLYSYRDFKNVDVDDLSRALNSSNFTPLLMLPIDDAIVFFNEKINAMFNTYVPLVTRKKIDPKTPWMTSVIMKLRRRRDEAFKKLKSISNPVEKETQRHIFNSLRNNVVSSIRNAKIQFYSRIFNQNLNTKQLWKNLKNHGVNNNSQVECTVCPNVLASVFFPVSCSSRYSFNVVTRTTPSFSFCDVSINEVLKAVSSIQSNAIGFDGISLKFFKIILPSVIGIFTDFLNRCLQTSTFPKAWKISKVIPVPKASANEYRPISLIPSLSKVFEKVVCNQITNFLERHKLLSTVQSGFRRYHSCKSAILYVSNWIGKEVDQNRIVFLVLIDFSKAFDAIIQSLLIRKLRLRFGFSQLAFQLLESYLNQRKSVVVNNDQLSDEIANNMGVPQGSILGPLLFSIYGEDMEDIFEFVHCHFYADDTQLFISCHPDDVVSTVEKINKDLMNIMSWSMRTD